MWIPSVMFFSGAMTLSIKILSIMTLSIMTLSLTTLSITTLSIMTSSIIVNKMQHSAREALLKGYDN